MEINKKLKIFIASSSAFIEFNSNGSINIEKSNKGKLKPVIEALNQCGFEPIPWYDNKKYLFKGESLLINLINASKRFDGAVIVIGNDIKKDEKFDIYIPNSNVLLEMGMFLSSHGKHRVYPIIERSISSEIELPSDLGGYIIDDFNNKDFRNDFKQFFSNTDSRVIFDRITFYHGTHLTNKLLEEKYKTWKSKGLYIGTESSRIWDTIESHDFYSQNISFLGAFIDDCINKFKIDFRRLHNIVSFGSGNGKTDRQLVAEIKKENDSICYVPVDINPCMAFMAVKEISSIPIRVPFVIIDDFEENPDHIENIIENKTHIIGQNNLFSLLGVTFSNLENTEDNVFFKMRKWMSQDDYLLLDALIQNGEDNNLVVNELKERLLNEDNLKPNYKKLLINSIKKKYRDDDYFNLTYNEIENISTNVKTTIQIEKMEKKQSEKYTKVKNTVILDCFLNYNKKRHTLLLAKRYDYEELAKKICQYFRIVHSDKNSETNRGLFLLRINNKK